MNRVVIFVCACVATVTYNAAEVYALEPGFVQGDVVSYSYVPNRYWSPDEAIGILPYLCEYELMAWDHRPLEAWHTENIRRIDLAAKWSTATMFYARRAEFRDELIRLMLRAYQYRQLFIIRDYWQPGDEKEPFANMTDLLETLWQSRDTVLENAEGDKATGRQLINNILMVKTGDENFGRLGTDGLGTIYRTFEERIRNRALDGETPFAHIRAWYNMVGFAGWNFGSALATGPDDVVKGRHRLPANTEFIGVDTYDYWWHNIGFDPVDPANAARVAARTAEWHSIRTVFYPEGVRTCVCKNANDPATWTPECWSDTHAVLNAVRFAEADRAMMIYIGLSSSLKGAYTTPVATMDAYYERLKAGPWVGLVWWTCAGKQHPKEYPVGTLGYVDKTLVHYTPEYPEGKPYPQETLDRLHDEFLTSRMRMFNDVVHSQFAHLNSPAAKPNTPPAEIANTLGMKLRWIPPGDFVMGSGEEEKGREDDESPPHTVKLTRGFYMGTTEVTQAQWAALMGTRPWADNRNLAKGDNLPAMYVTWDDANAFCRKLSEQEGRTYRLPTEAEWEYACRAGTRTWFYWGNAFDEAYAWSNRNSDDRFHEVAARKPNPWGLFDMGGNAWEWCSDWHGPYTDAAATDPTGPKEGEKRVLRSGSYSNHPLDCRAAERGACDPADRAGSIGFRVVAKAAFLQNGQD